MSQHDFVIDNQTGLQFRSELNDVLAAIVSNNSGATEPTTTYAFMWWLDTANTQLKIRNAANNAWVIVFDYSSSSAASMIAALGSLSLAGYRFYNDPNTGLYSPGADAAALIAGGTAYLKVSTADGAEALGTAAFKVPVGTTAQRPTGANGHVRYNSDLGAFEGYKASGWAGLGGGGGGAGFLWRGLSGTAPLVAEEYGEQVYLFQDAASQELYASVKVPQSYSAGAQIFIYVSAYSPSASNTWLLRAQSTLIRPGTTAFDSTTNQRTTTNTQVTNDNAKELTQVALDVTHTDGTINSVAVAAGDVIKLRLYRDTGTSDTADVRMIPNGTDAKFS